MRQQHGNWSQLPLQLFVVLAAILAFSLATTPEPRLNWFLEMAPALIGFVALFATYKQFPFSRWVYVGIFVHVLILAYGGHYTYAKNPLGNWAKDVFQMSRNNYDKIGHFAFGFFPVFTLREVLFGVTQLERNKWLNFILINVILGFAAIYEFIEWGSALAMDPSGGDAFLGTQGYVWDAQSDMLYAGIGACIGLLFFSNNHDASINVRGNFFLSKT
jgi:putative membrane protein